MYKIVDKLKYDKLFNDKNIPKMKDYFHFYRCQINFALFASITALGTSNLHIAKGDDIIKSIYLFYIYYHMRRILHRLN